MTISSLSCYNVTSLAWMNLMIRVGQRQVTNLLHVPVHTWTLDMGGGLVLQEAQIIKISTLPSVIHH